MTAILPPHSIEAEEATLGSALIDPDAAIRWMDGLQPGEFYLEKHKWVWAAIQGMSRRGLTADLLSVAVALGEERLREAGGDAWLAHLTEAVPSALNVDTYVEVVKVYALRRRQIRAAEQIAKAAWDLKLTAEQVQQAVAEAMLQAMDQQRVGRPKSQKEVMREILERIDALQDGRIESKGITTGLLDLDFLTDGLFKKELTVLGGRPGMGKSGLLMHIADSASAKGNKVLIFTLEMENAIWGGRLLSSRAAVDARKINRTGKLDTDELARAYEHAGKLGDRPVWLFDQRGLTDLDIRTVARQMASAVGGLDLIVGDHLTLMRSAKRYDRNDLEVGACTLSLRNMAYELNCAVLWAAQLSRRIEERSDKRPMLSDFRESGQIEEHIDGGWSLYRDEYYTPDTDLKGIAEIGVLKARNGAVGKVHVGYDATRQTFYSIQRETIAL